ncbi:MAG: hypothetical protein U5S82_19750 [Gammaproteobacteria bacterium]|nr:hypothetical protein [Gammaproteobacteria bacterium]
MIDRSQENEAVTLDLTTGRPQRSGNSRVHREGETTGMFRIRTAEAIQVDLEAEVDVDQLPDYLRRFIINPDAR